MKLTTQLQTNLAAANRENEELQRQAELLVTENTQLREQVVALRQSLQDVMAMAQRFDATIHSIATQVNSLAPFAPRDLKVIETARKLTH